MSYRIKLLPTFSRAAKPLIKKFPSLATELRRLQKILRENPTHGESLGRNCYKIRLAIESKGVGKSGGARVITYVTVVAEEVVLLTMYDKAERANLDPNELKELLKLLEQ